MRLIDADTLKEELNNWAVDLTKSKFPHYIKDDADYIIDNAPTIDPVRHGRWLDCEWESGFKFVCCSECKRSDMDSRFYNYCPNCGAKMDEEVEA